MTIRAGSVTGLVGPDGAGKTTLMRILAGLMRQDDGRVQVLGLDPIAEENALHAVLGYMPQKFGLYEDLTVQENLNLYADLRSVTARCVSRRSPGCWNSPRSARSPGGSRQTLRGHEAKARPCLHAGGPAEGAAARRAGVGVDPISRRELWQMVHALAGDGMLILWSTSYLDEAEQCREVLLMNEGELLYRGARSAHRANGGPQPAVAPR